MVNCKVKYNKNSVGRISRRERLGQRNYLTKMDMKSKNQYLIRLIRKHGGYHLKSKKEKGKLLKEYCRVSGENRKSVIRKIRTGSHIKKLSSNQGAKQRRASYYDSYTVVALIKCWEIFDYASGQRLAPLVQDEIDKLRKLGEVSCSAEAAGKLKKISPATIDRKLKREKAIQHLNQKYKKKNNPLLYQKIPVKMSWEQNRNRLGYLQIDLVEHCGQSAKGEYINTVSSTELATSWWDGRAVMGKGRKAVAEAIKRQKKESVFEWQGLHTDNGSEFINGHLYQISNQEKLEFTRSRPLKKNDNCYVEQKNWTHVKKFVGYQRYDTKAELEMLNQLYKDLRIYKNFYQTAMHLKEKVRIRGKITRRYGPAKTPYKRIMEAKGVSDKRKQALKRIYNQTNPAELKRNIEQKIRNLHKLYQGKQTRSRTVKQVWSKEKTLDLEPEQTRKWNCGFREWPIKGRLRLEGLQLPQELSENHLTRIKEFA